MCTGRQAGRQELEWSAAANIHLQDTSTVLFSIIFGLYDNWHTCMHQDIYNLYWRSLCKMCGCYRKKNCFDATLITVQPLVNTSIMVRPQFNKNIYKIINLWTIYLHFGFWHILNGTELFYSTCRKGCVHRKKGTSEKPNLENTLQFVYISFNWSYNI